MQRIFRSLVRLLSNFDSSQRWCRTISMRSQCFQKLLDMCDIADDPDTRKAGKHRELENAQMKNPKKQFNGQCQPFETLI